MTFTKTFHSELVPQDPRDAPASELLARIRTVRDANTATKSAKSTKRRKPAEVDE